MMPETKGRNKSEPKYPCACGTERKTGCLKCVGCGIWFHLACTPITAAILTQIEIRGLTWKCDTCLDVPEPSQLSDLQESVTSILERQKDIKDSIISSVKPIIEETLLKTITPLIERSVSENLNAKKDDVTQISKTTATTNVPIKPVDYHNTVNCVRINGIFEDCNKSFSENTMDTSARLEGLFAVLNVKAEVSSVKRLGKFHPARVRPWLNLNLFGMPEES